MKLPSYNPSEIEPKWQQMWEKKKRFVAKEGTGKKKYVLDMFPYPSAQGLHVGHPLSYTATDILARKYRMEGYRVLHPMGFDAFGLPAENYAIKTQTHPAVTTEKAMEHFREQLKMLGFSYDWTREVNTSSPEYYRWTQWLFLVLYKHGLAYKREAPVNWCESCHTVLANEQVENGNCERCKNPVMQKMLKQWFFRITKYADRLLAGHDKLDWPERTLAAQKNWIGRSEGASIVFTAESGEPIEVFTTRPDTLFGVTYVVLAPEHPLVAKITTPEQLAAVSDYQKVAAKKSELERGAQEEKTGVFTGGFVSHPLTGKKVPVWVADYVVATYGTGAVMAVPAHDERDFAFARKYELPIITVVKPTQGEAEEGACFTEAGVATNSGEIDGLTTSEAKERVIALLEAAGKGSKKVQYRLRDWLVSRQRFWGAPIPIVHCEGCGEVPVPEQDLPVTLPDDVDFRPTGESPLARSEKFHKVNCPKCGRAARRESDTMDTFVDSSWYFLRYVDPKNNLAFADPKKLEAWCPVDMYVGGMEHATSHLMFARFFTKVLFDYGYLNFEEPFTSLRNQGLILGSDGQKMSKSRGNVVNPDDVVKEHGADTMRLYLMFMGPFEDAKPWDDKSIIGVRRFLEKVWRLAEKVETVAEDEAALRLRHMTTKKITEAIESFSFNTAISALMIAVNELQSRESVPRETFEAILKLLAPFAPHITEELWEHIGGEGLIERGEWPTFEEALAKTTTVTIAVQVNGKVRDTLMLPPGAPKEEVLAKAEALEKVQTWTSGKKVVKVIHVPDRLINIVVSE